jgi:phosphoglycolate phosphatase-like HAD superfamily hydrolase
MLSTICRKTASASIFRRIKAKQEKHICLRASAFFGHSYITVWSLESSLHFMTPDSRLSGLQTYSKGELMIKAVIFDIDGTLVDSVDLHARAWQETFKHFGKEIPYNEVRHQIGKGGDQLMPVFFSKEKLDEKGSEMEKYRGELFKRDYLPQVRAFPRVRELFLRIREDGKRLALASSAKEDELKTYKKIADIEDLVEEETSADDADKSKPHPDIFEAALESLGDIKAHEAIVIGDTPYDAEAAGKINLQTIGVLCGGFPEAELKTAGCIQIYKDPADLLIHYDDSVIMQN